MGFIKLTRVVSHYEPTLHTPTEKVTFSHVMVNVSHVRFITDEENHRYVILGDRTTISVVESMSQITELIRESAEMDLMP